MGAAILTMALLASPVTDPAASAAAIPASQRAFADCVSDRESHGNYEARGSDSSSAGRWQFLDRPWRNGLSYMVAARLREFGMSGKDSKAGRGTASGLRSTSRCRARCSCRGTRGR